jgi:hypothetical protein
VCVSSGRVCGDAELAGPAVIRPAVEFGLSEDSRTIEVVHVPPLRYPKGQEVAQQLLSLHDISVEAVILRASVIHACNQLGRSLIHACNQLGVSLIHACNQLGVSLIHACNQLCGSFIHACNQLGVSLIHACNQLCNSLLHCLQT